MIDKIKGNLTFAFYTFETQIDAGFDFSNALLLLQNWKRVKTELYVRK